MSVIIDRIKKRINKLDKNCLVLICGSTGSGKSFSAIKIALAIDPEFDLDSHLVFTAKGFLDLLNSDKLKHGQVIIWDEAGVGIPAREWYSILNKAVGYVLQTFRHLNLCVIFTVPDLSFVDISLRKLFHFYFETQTIDYKNNICTLKPFEIEVNPQTTKIYRKYPRIRREGRIIKLTKLEIELLDQEKIDQYEIRKNGFTKELNFKLSKEINRAEAKDKKPELTDEECIEIIQKKIGDEKKRTISKISAILNISQHRARKIKDLCSL
jgi:energy-coupling factor transporter ATP-binding protein EcfA2